MLAHPMATVLEAILTNQDLTAEYQRRRQLHVIRAMERHGLMELVEKGERLADVLEALGGTMKRVGVAEDELRQGRTDMLRTIFGDAQVDAMLARLPEK